MPKSITTLQDYLLKKEGLKQYIDQTVLNISKKNQWDKLHHVLNQTFVDNNFEQVEGKKIFEFIEKRCKNEIIVGRLAKISEAEREALLAAALPEKQTYLWKQVGEKNAKRINKALPWLDVGLSSYELYKAIQAYQSTKDKLTSVEIQFRELADLYLKDFGAHGFRMGIGLLEKDRVASVLCKMKKREATDNATEKAIDLVLGIVSLIPGGSEVAGVIIAIKALGSATIKALTTFAGWVDKYLFEFQVSNLFGMNPTLQEIRKHSQHNQLLLQDEIQERKKANKKLETDPRLQFRIRAEAIYGLAALLTRASISYGVTSAKGGKARKKKYFEKIKQYHVKEYIQIFLLRDGWQVPFHPAIPMTLDKFWLYIIGPKYIINPKRLLDNFGVKHPLAKEALKDGPGMHMGIFSPSIDKDNIKATFQNSFPIQHIDSKRIEDFAWGLRTQTIALEKDSIEYSCIYKRPKTSKQDSDWKPINPNARHQDSPLTPLSPFDQVRVLIVLKKGARQDIYPVSIQLRRVSGSNISDGPVYRDITRTLDHELLPGEKDFKGRLGCVLYPFYTMGAKTIPGIKPMSYSGEFRIGASKDNLDWHGTQDYAFWYKVGGRLNEGWLDLGSPNNKLSNLNEFPMSIDPKRDKEEKLLLDETFLKSRSAQTKYPSLFKQPAQQYKTPVKTPFFQIPNPDRLFGTGPLYYRYGKSEKDFKRLSQKRKHFKDYRWDNHLELIVIVWATELEKDKYSKVRLDWRKIPFFMQIVNKKGDVKGPMLSSQLHFLGIVKDAWKRFIPAHDKRGRRYRSPADPIVDILRNNPRELSELNTFATAQGIPKSHPDCHVFGAHFVLKYRTPSGKEAHGVRPFASKLIRHPRYYHYGFINLQTAPSSGFSVDSLKNAKKSGFRTIQQDYVLCFPAPKRYTSGVVWAKSKGGQGDDDLKRLLLSEKKIEEWITKRTTTLDPQVHILKKEK